MDSIDIIKLLLFTLTVIAAVGFAGTIYHLREICRALTKPEAGGSSGGMETRRGTGLARSTPSLEEIDPRSAGNLEECLGTITEKYGLASFTLATADGLLIGSTKAGAEDEAARCSYLYTQGKLQDETGAELLGIPHHGEVVIGIIRPSDPLSAELASALERDTRNALQHWV